jgi:hypothetical protein
MKDTDMVAPGALKNEHGGAELINARVHRGSYSSRARARVPYS